ncbi:hypothetical protein VCUG_00493 [Vavraia culicis subsp. floridensis]|uniref:Uncharacterized protein n=1 Tax=Vavraia culicis (isolate floridensis) TaxID=948595 RepID=L2GYA1_VAVCU|nr:uncharacterized protein VCUG_00493 [Vavraia culicis subsp. floridensis]ELA48070.1 hypothetical protein VCUG_00493 [Vavraia culicis subsp. floridensis]
MHFCNFLSLVLAISASQKIFEKKTGIKSDEIPDNSFKETSETSRYHCMVKYFLDLCDLVDNYSDATNSIWKSLANELKQQSSNYSYDKRTKIKNLCKDLKSNIKTLTSMSEKLLRISPALEPILTIEMIKNMTGILNILITALHNLNCEFDIFDTQHELLEELEDAHTTFFVKHKKFLGKIKGETTPNTCSLDLEEDILLNIGNLCHVVLLVQQDILNWARIYTQNTPCDEKNENPLKRQLDTSSDADEDDHSVTTPSKKLN